MERPRPAAGFHFHGRLGERPGFGADSASVADCRLGTPGYGTTAKRAPVCAAFGSGWSLDLDARPWRSARDWFLPGTKSCRYLFCQLRDCQFANAVADAAADDFAAED